jgi:hypothetical protein
MAFVAAAAFVTDRVEAKGSNKSMSNKGNKGTTSSGTSGFKTGQNTGNKGTTGNGSQGSKTDNKGKGPYGKNFKGKDGKSYQYTHCPSYLEHCCHYGDYCGWSRYCWFDRYGCCGCYCPERCCWYYWYEPYYCYLPCQYMQTYTPVEVAEQVVNVNTNTNVNGTGSTAIPALPDGASAVPAGFMPPAPKQ